MKSVTKYIENVLRLKVNRGKSKIGRPTEIQYLGFAFYYQFQEKKYKITTLQLFHKKNIVQDFLMYNEFDPKHYKGK